MSHVIYNLILSIGLIIIYYLLDRLLPSMELILSNNKTNR